MHETYLGLFRGRPYRSPASIVLNKMLPEVSYMSLFIFKLHWGGCSLTTLSMNYQHHIGKSVGTSFIQSIIKLKLLEYANVSPSNDQVSPLNI